MIALCGNEKERLARWAERWSGGKMWGGDGSRNQGGALRWASRRPFGARTSEQTSDEAKIAVYVWRWEEAERVYRAERKNQPGKPVAFASR